MPDLRVYRSLATATALLFLAGACGEDGPAATSDCDGDVERTRVLNNVLSTATAGLNRSAFEARRLEDVLTAAVASPSEATVEAAREVHRRARVSLAQHGAYLLLYDEAQAALPSVTAFPVDTATVMAYVRDGDFDAASAPDFDRGYAAIEFLLYGTNPTRTTELLLAEPARLMLARAYAADVATRLTAAEERWDGSVREELLAAEGTAAGSGLSRVINSLSKHYEDTRRDRLGIPFGVTLGFPTPSALEAPYSGRSLEYLTTNIISSQFAFGQASDPATLAAYTAELNNDEGDALAADISAQYAAGLAALKALDRPLSEAIVDDRDAVQTAYNAISRQVINLKTDLPSVTCVSITYVDNPSDSD